MAPVSPQYKFSSLQQMRHTSESDIHKIVADGALKFDGKVYRIRQTEDNTLKVRQEGKKHGNSSGLMNALFGQPADYSRDISGTLNKRLRTLQGRSGPEAQVPQDYAPESSRTGAGMSELRSRPVTMSPLSTPAEARRGQPSRPAQYATLTLRPGGASASTAPTVRVAPDSRQPGVSMLRPATGGYTQPLSQPRARVAPYADLALTGSEILFKSMESFEGLEQWASQLNPRRLSDDSVYEAFKSAHAMPPRTFTHGERDRFFEQLLVADAIRGVHVAPQELTARNKIHSGRQRLDRFLADRPYTSSSYMHMTPSRNLQRLPEVPSRLVLNIQPQYLTSAVSWLGRMVSEKPYIAKCKITEPGTYGHKPDAIIFYLTGYADQAMDLVQAIKREFPPEALRDLQPFGTFAIDQGIYYAERTPEAPTSHGKSRVLVLQDALKRSSSTPLTQRLQKALDKAGYDPANPAFVKNSPGLRYLLANQRPD